MNGQNICAVVVTYNRKELLMECLDGIRNQTVPVQGVTIVDNASTDNTPQLLFEKGYIKELPPKELKEPWETSLDVSIKDENLKIHYVRMNKNTGGAGGFYEGIKRSYQKGYDWLWLMDDDTIPTPTTLEELLKAFEIDDKIGFACSKALWVDNTPHLMNIPQISPIINGAPFNKYEDKNFLLINGASFVSLLLPSRIVKEIGLPIKELFLWSDDIEYTTRIIESGYLGAYCPKSIVYHKTKTNYSASMTTDNFKYFLKVRNGLILQKRHKLRFWFYLLLSGKTIFELMGKKQFQLAYVHTKATIAAIFFKIKIDRVKNAS